MIRWVPWCCSPIECGMMWSFCLHQMFPNKWLLSQHLNKERTSTNAWCVEDCFEDNTTQAVIKRLENITGIPDTNSEYLQLLRVRYHHWIVYPGLRIELCFLTFYVDDTAWCRATFCRWCSFFKQYEVGQKYGQHHDYIQYVSSTAFCTCHNETVRGVFIEIASYNPTQKVNCCASQTFLVELQQTNRQCGVRIITVFLYLNDVEAGGGTDFPFLNLTVMPKKGSVLIWPSVLDANPNEKDPRTEHVSNTSCNHRWMLQMLLWKWLVKEDTHTSLVCLFWVQQALPVEAGTKYGANAWVHQRSFKEPYNKSCI